jgi:hypothetical protein
MLDGVFEWPLELESDVRRFVSMWGGCGDLDIWEGEREGGKEERDVFGFPLP